MNDTKTIKSFKAQKREIIVDGEFCKYFENNLLFATTWVWKMCTARFVSRV